MLVGGEKDFVRVNELEFRFYLFANFCRFASLSSVLAILSTFVSSVFAEKIQSMNAFCSPSV